MANLLCFHLAVSKNQKENVEGGWEKNQRKSEGDEEVGGKIENTLFLKSQYIIIKVIKITTEEKSRYLYEEIMHEAPLRIRNADNRI